MLASVQPLPLIHLPRGVDVCPIPVGHVAGALPQVLVPIGEAVHPKAVAFAGLVVPCGGGRGGGLRLCGPQTDLAQSSSLCPGGPAAACQQAVRGWTVLLWECLRTLAKVKARALCYSTSCSGSGHIWHN